MFRRFALTRRTTKFVFHIGRFWPLGPNDRVLSKVRWYGNWFSAQTKLIAPIGWYLRCLKLTLGLKRSWLRFRLQVLSESEPLSWSLLRFRQPRFLAAKWTKTSPEKPIADISRGWALDHNAYHLTLLKNDFCSSAVDRLGLSDKDQI